MTQPSEEQLKWLESISDKDGNPCVDIYWHLTTVSWDDEEFLHGGEEALYAEDFKIVTFILYKYICLILKYKPNRADFDHIYYAIDSRMVEFLCEPRENLELIYQWMITEGLKFQGTSEESIHSNKYGFCLDLIYRTEVVTTVYLTIKYYLYPSKLNVLKHHSIKDPYSYTFNKTALLLANPTVNSIQLDWIEQALKQEQLEQPGIELEQTLSSVSWDTPEFLGVCKLVFYSSQYETARYIAMKYIELSIKFMGVTPVASTDLMFFLYKNIGNLLHSSTKELEMLLLWFETVYIPPRPLSQFTGESIGQGKRYIKLHLDTQYKNDYPNFYLSDYNHYFIHKSSAEVIVYRYLKSFLNIQRNNTNKIKLYI